MTALNNFNEQVREFYRQAVDCARQADAQNDPKVKQQFLELKRLWLLWRSVASSIKPNSVTRPPLPADLICRGIGCLLRDSSGVNGNVDCLGSKLGVMT
jgi:hypothetical protein